VIQRTGFFAFDADLPSEDPSTMSPWFMLADMIENSTVENWLIIKDDENDFQRVLLHLGLS
jgi:hypothetical protein